MAAPKIVILGDNSLTGDSRVIKQIRTAVAAGYETIAIGVTPGPGYELKQFGARMILVTMYQAEQSVVGAIPQWLSRRFSPTAHEAKSAELQSLRVAAHRDQSRVQQSGIGSRIQRTSINARLAKIRVRRSFNDRMASQTASAVATGVERNHAKIAKMQDPRILAQLEVLDPGTFALQAVVAPVLAELNPDIVHANDYRTISLALDYAKTARESGRPVAIVYDSHEWLPGYTELGTGRHAFAQAAERDGITQVDSVITVSTEIAARIQSHYGLPSTPLVVQNSPEVPGELLSGPTLRQRLRLSHDQFLAVYSGSVGSGRDLELCIDAIVEVPTAVLAFVVSTPDRDRIRKLKSRAQDAGVADRVRFVRFVPQEQIVSYLREADVGLIPFERNANNDVAVPTKTREYAGAQVPIITSDVPALAEFVSRFACGEIYSVGDSKDLGAAIDRVIDNGRSRYTAGLAKVTTESTWQTEAATLRTAWSSALAVSDIAPPDSPADGDLASLRPRKSLASESAGSRIVLGVGPLPAATGLMSSLNAINATPIGIDPDDQPERASAAVWHELAQRYTHCLLVSGRSLVADGRNAAETARELDCAEAEGVRLGSLLLGPEVLTPTPRGGETPMELRGRERRAVRRRMTAEFFGLPIFTTNYDLAQSWDVAIWLPLALADIVPISDSLAPEPRDQLTVLDLRRKGEVLESRAVTRKIRNTCNHHGAKLITRRLATQSGPLDAAIAGADIVIDSQISNRGYTIEAVTALAHGKVVLSTFSGDPSTAPVVNTSEETLGTELARVLTDASLRDGFSMRGSAWVDRYHRGDASRAAVKSFLKTKS